MSFIVNQKNYLRSRDCAIFRKSESITIKVSDAMVKRGWAGGSFVRWVNDGTGDPCVDIGNGTYCGFVPFGSNEVADQYTAMTNQNPTYKYVVLFFGGNLMGTISYEKYTYLSRHSGPLVPLVYNANDFLYVSENGLITNQDESNSAVNPGGLFPDGSPILTPFTNFGVCAVPPVEQTDNYIIAQML